MAKCSKCKEVECEENLVLCSACFAEEDYSSMEVKFGLMSFEPDGMEEVPSMSASELMFWKGRGDYLQKELDELKKIQQLDRDALKLLISICKSKGFDPFSGELRPIYKGIKNMTREELVAHHKEAIGRMNRKASSSEGILEFPNWEEQMKLYEKFSFVGELIINAKNHYGFVSIDDFKGLYAEYAQKVLDKNKQ